MKRFAVRLFAFVAFVVLGARLGWASVSTTIDANGETSTITALGIPPGSRGHRRCNAAPLLLSRDVHGSWDDFRRDVWVLPPSPAPPGRLQRLTLRRSRAAREHGSFPAHRRSPMHSTELSKEQAERLSRGIRQSLRYLNRLRTRMEKAVLAK